MSRNVAHLTYTYHSDDGSVMKDPKCHTCMNRIFHEHALDDVSVVYVSTLAGLIPFTIRSLIFTNGDYAPFTLTAISENLVVLRCTDELHVAAAGSVTNAVEKIAQIEIVPEKKSILKSFSVPSRKRNAGEAELIKRSCCPSSPVIKKMNLVDDVPVNTTSEISTDQVHLSTSSTEFSHSLSKCKDILRGFKFVANRDMCADQTAKTLKFNNDYTNFETTSETFISNSTNDVLPQNFTDCDQVLEFTAPETTSFIPIYPLITYTSIAIGTTEDQLEHINDAKDCTNKAPVPVSSAVGLTLEQISHYNQRSPIENFISPEVDKCLNTVDREYAGVPSVNRPYSPCKNAEVITGTTTGCCTEIHPTVSTDVSTSEQLRSSSQRLQQLQDSSCSDVDKCAAATKIKSKYVPDANTTDDAHTGTNNIACATENSSKLDNIASSQEPGQCKQESDPEDVIWLAVVNKSTTTSFLKISTKSATKIKSGKPPPKGVSIMGVNMQVANPLALRSIQSGIEGQLGPTANVSSTVPGCSYSKPIHEGSSFCNGDSLNRSKFDTPVDFPFVLGRRSFELDDPLSESDYNLEVFPFLKKLTPTLIKLLANIFITLELKPHCQQCDRKFDAQNTSSIVSHYLSRKHCHRTCQNGFEFSHSRDFMRLIEVCKEIEASGGPVCQWTAPTPESPAGGAHKLTPILKIPFVLGCYVKKGGMPFEKLFNIVSCLKESGVLTDALENFIMEQFPKCKTIIRCRHCGTLPPSPNGRGHYFSHFLSIEHVFKAMKKLYDFSRDWGTFKSYLGRYSRKLKKPKIFRDICSEVDSAMRDRVYSSNNATFADLARRLEISRKNKRI